MAKKYKKKAMEVTIRYKDADEYRTALADLDELIDQTFKDEKELKKKDRKKLSVTVIRNPKKLRVTFTCNRAFAQRAALNDI